MSLMTRVSFLVVDMDGAWVLCGALLGSYYCVYTVGNFRVLVTDFCQFSERRSEKDLLDLNAVCTTSLRNSRHIALVINPVAVAARHNKLKLHLW